MTEQEKKETGRRLLSAFQKMHNAIGLSHIAVESNMPMEAKGAMTRAVLLKLMEDLMSIYPTGALSRHDLVALGEQFGMAVTLVELDPAKAVKAANN